MIKTITKDDFDNLVLACLDEVTDEVDNPAHRLNLVLTSMLVLIPLKQKLFGEEQEDEKIFKIAA